MKRGPTTNKITNNVKQRKRTPELIRCLKPNEFDGDHNSLIFDFECEAKRQDDTVCLQCLQLRKFNELRPQKKTLYPQKGRNKPILNEVTITANQEYIKRLYSFLGKLDKSFWKEPKFMMWQLLRLNKNYWNDIDTLADIYWNYLNDTNTHKWVEPIFYRLGTNYFPDPEGTFDLWIKRKEAEVWSLQRDILQLHEKFDGINLLDVDECLNLMTMKDSTGQQFLLSPLSLYAADYLPIDYTVRFPLPNFLDRLPEFKDEIKKKKGGRPLENIPLSLLIYEL
jgi:hypothetical protein